MTAQIQFTQGCPNGCEYCYEPKREFKCFEPIIPPDKEIQILDMNFLANPKAKEILKSLPKRKWEFICGVDFRLLDQEICDLMKKKGFIDIRWAWDYNFGAQGKHYKVWRMFQKAGYIPEQLSIFVLVNWHIPYTDCMRKLDLMKVWGVKINDCCWDGGYEKAKPTYWSLEQITDFRKRCRKHNQLIRFKVDPEY